MEMGGDGDGNGYHKTYKRPYGRTRLDKLDYSNAWEPPI